MMVFIAKKLLLDREIAGLQFNIFKDQSNTQLSKSFTKLCDSDDIITGTFVDLRKGKSDWKVEFKDGFVRINDKEYLFKTADAVFSLPD